MRGGFRKVTCSTPGVCQNLVMAAWIGVSTMLPPRVVFSAGMNRLSVTQVGMSTGSFEISAVESEAKASMNRLRPDRA